jgi:hypothetical protein
MVGRPLHLRSLVTLIHETSGLGNFAREKEFDREFSIWKDMATDMEHRAWG